MKKRKKIARTSAGTRPNRNEIARRIALREGGASESNIAEIKDTLAREWEEICFLERADLLAHVAAEVRAAERRIRNRNLS